jgi:two-component system, OmpR family, sensor histidine kinase ChvG
MASDIASGNPERRSRHEMSSEAHREAISTSAGARWRRSRWRLRARWLRRAVEARFSSSLTRRIVTLNLGGLVVLVVGFLLLSQFRADIIDARTQSLTTQADIIAAAIAASAAVGTDTITLDPEKLLQLAPGETPPPAPNDEDAITFSINPERVGPVLHRLVTPTHTRARIYDRDGLLLLDSQTVSSRASTSRADATDPANEDTTWLQRAWSVVRRVFVRPKAPRGRGNWADNGKSRPEVAEALAGKVGSIVRVNSDGETIVSVAVPIQRTSAIRGALVLSTQGRDIDKVIASERWALLRYFLVAAAVMLILSISQANTIAEPLRKLAEAAERVQRGIRSRQQIPDFTNRSDEIGHLSRALGEMTHALYSRIEAIESFAADVAHELKNPLTSLRSAVETLPRVKSASSRDRLLSIMQHDVRRLDRLISDISDASRLAAELARGDAEPVDVEALLRAVVSMIADSPRSRGIVLRVTIDDAETEPGVSPYLVLGHDSRLAQVITNLVDNACSFSRPGGEVRIHLGSESGAAGGDAENPQRIVLTVEDDGPGIPPHALERIFERFYTDRPDDGFGQNSGLGLSISRQIVQAHFGGIWAENRPLTEDPAPPDPETDAPVRHGAGARFVVSLPACPK